MTSSDAPQPPGGPLRQDAPDGGFAEDAPREELPSGDASDGGDGSGDVPPVTGEDEQPAEAAAVQEENAETSLDQPSQ